MHPAPIEVYFYEVEVFREEVGVTPPMSSFVASSSESFSPAMAVIVYSLIVARLNFPNLWFVVEFKIKFYA